MKRLAGWDHIREETCSLTSRLEKKQHLATHGMDFKSTTNGSELGRGLGQRLVGSEGEGALWLPRNVAGKPWMCTGAYSHELCKPHPTVLLHVLCSSPYLLLLLRLNHFYVLLRHSKKLIKLSDNLDSYLKLH